MSFYFEQRMAEIDAETTARLKAAPRHIEKPPTPGKTVQQGYVYFFRAGNAVKIGFSTNLVQRSKQLQTGMLRESLHGEVSQGHPAH
jgi:hypothetical protein